MSKVEAAPALTPELAVEILNKTLDDLQSPDNLQKLDKARENVGNEMLKMMQFVFPVVMQIQMDVIKDYGFAEGREGIIKFAQLLRGLEREDEEVARLHSLIKAHYMPGVAVSETNEGAVDEKVNSG